MQARVSLLAVCSVSVQVLVEGLMLLENSNSGGCKRKTRLIEKQYENNLLQPRAPVLRFVERQCFLVSYATLASISNVTPKELCVQQQKSTKTSFRNSTLSVLFVAPLSRCTTSRPVAGIASNTYTAAKKSNRGNSSNARRPRSLLRAASTRAMGPALQDPGILLMRLV